MTHLPSPRRWPLLAVLLLLHAGVAWLLAAGPRALPRTGDASLVNYVTMVPIVPPAAPRPKPASPPPEAPARKRQAIARSAPVQAEAVAELMQPAAPAAAPAAEPAPSAGPLDKDAVLGAARSPGLLTPEEKARAVKDIRSMDDNKFARAISKAARPNCIDAVKKGQGNVLALVPMIINDLRDKGCKW